MGLSDTGILSAPTSHQMQHSVSLFTSQLVLWGLVQVLTGRSCQSKGQVRNHTGLSSYFSLREVKLSFSPTSGEGAGAIEKGIGCFNRCGKQGFQAKQNLNSVWKNVGNKLLLLITNAYWPQLFCISFDDKRRGPKINGMRNRLQRR